MPTTGEGDTTAEAFDDAAKPGRVAFRQPFNGAYGTAPDGNCVHCCRFEAADRGVWGLACREESEDVDRRLCIEDAPEWVDA